MTERRTFSFGLLVLLAALLYGVWQWHTLSDLKVEADQLQMEVSTLTSSSTTLASDYQAIRQDVRETRETSAQEMVQVFPTEENLSDLTRLFDNFAVTNNFASNPFFVSELSYQEAKAPDGLSYQYIPVSMHITTSKKNLNKFLEFVENSGSLEGQIRLMSIENLSIDYPNEYGGVYEVQIDLNAYFAKGL